MAEELSRNFRLLIFGSKELSLSSKVWVEIQLRTLLTKFKKEHPDDLFVYSSLDEGASLLGAEICCDLDIPVLGCIPFLSFPNTFKKVENSRQFRMLYPSIFNLKVVGESPNYETYRKRDLYLLHQSNFAICIWDQQEESTRYFWGLLMSRWANTKNQVYHINYKNHTNNNFLL